MKPPNLSKEGEELWDNMDNPDYIEKLTNPEPKVKKTRKVNSKMTERILLLQENSLKVQQSCARLVKIETDNENYFKAHEAKVAFFCHKNFYDRLQRILDDKDPIEEVVNNDINRIMIQ